MRFDQITEKIKRYINTEYVVRECCECLADDLVTTTLPDMIGKFIRLESENDTLRARIAELERERDAAVEDLKAVWPCFFCVRWGVYANKGPCTSCRVGSGLHWQWRGPREA